MPARGAKSVRTQRTVGGLSTSSTAGISTRSQTIRNGGKSNGRRVAKSAAPSKTRPASMDRKTRTLRDPIHGDMLISALESAVVDTRIFQRLRYIRQNGLLHFVFPGAVHTRFAHSLGTMFIAGQVFDRLFAPYAGSADREESRSIEYLRSIFRLAALLHDVGHCAFSHSIERVKIDGMPVFGTISELFGKWGRQDLLAEYLTVYPQRAAAPVEHEQIGLILVQEIFAQASASAACTSETGVPAADLARDVMAIMDGGLSPSASYDINVKRVRKVVLRTLAEPGAVSLANFQSDMLTILHNLVSGTLDVDRLDYLVRDSAYCGVPYGRCDVQILVGSLSFGPLSGNLVLFLADKAAYALDDMLWSRYQLFVQVLNHKTNVGLNASLSRAIEEAANDSLLEVPQTLSKYIGFTDDFVMSRVIEACLNGKLASRSYAKALVDRKVPLHVHVVDAKPSITAAGLQKRFAEEYACPLEDVYVADAKSEFIKEGPLPMLRSWSKQSKVPSLRPFREGSSAVFARSKQPVMLHKIHVFVDRDVAQKQQKQQKGKEQWAPQTPI